MTSLCVYEAQMTVAWPESHAGRIYWFASEMRSLVDVGISDAYWLNEDGVGVYRASLHLAYYGDRVEKFEAKLARIEALIADEKLRGGAVVAMRSQRGER